jgi:hypothetical protein
MLIMYVKLIIFNKLILKIIITIDNEKDIIKN